MGRAAGWTTVASFQGRWRTLGVAGWMAAAAAAAPSCSHHREPPPHEDGVLTVSVEQQASWIRNFNPLMPPSARWPTVGGIYEPLLVYNRLTGQYVPWLAKSYGWEEGGMTLRFEIRDGVLWSDGHPFTAADVVFTFTLLRKHRALDLSGVWDFLKSVEAEGPHQIRFQFARPFVPGLHYLAHQPIVAKHIWAQVQDPISFANPDPVATGPFTEVRVFRNQVYELGRNSRYWQAPKPWIKALRFPAYPSNDQANLALLNSEVDWAANFVPAIDRIFVAKDPSHHRYWFPLVGPTIFLYANTTRPPFDDVRVRKALSMGFDRELMAKVAMYGYTRPADGTGLCDAYAEWRSAAATKKAVWVNHNVELANQLLDSAGYPRDASGIRRLANGEPWAFDIEVVSGWSDWVRAAQVMAQGFKDLGVSISVKAYDFSAWFERLQKGNFALAVSWSVEAPTPYGVYRWLMSPGTVKPIGELAASNWHRFGSPEADKLLRAFEKSTDPVMQKKLVTKLQEVFVEQVPAIPLFPSPAWAAFNTRRFLGFPTADNPYAVPSLNSQPEYLLALTSIRPR